jgi:MerR family transcriptional regulator, light-induced transcriptional regulator
MSNYSIKDLEHLSGIKAHTLRIWEQRFNLISPGRTDTNIRYYSDKDLKLVLNISLLKEHGYKISDIVKLSFEELSKEVMSVSEKLVNYPDQIHSLTIAMIDLDEDRFEKTMSTSTLQFGFENTVINIIYPFLNRIGILWMTGSIAPAQEHFISNLIRQKIIVAIDGQLLRHTPDSKKFVLFNPEGEFHELGILFAAYLIRARNHKVIYLGQSLPFEDLKFVCDTHSPHYILASITTTREKEDLQEYVFRLNQAFPAVNILMTGLQVIKHELRLPSGVKIIRHARELIEAIEHA